MFCVVGVLSLILSWTSFRSLDIDDNSDTAQLEISEQGDLEGFRLGTVLVCSQMFKILCNQDCLEISLSDWVAIGLEHFIWKSDMLSGSREVLEF